MAAWNPNEEGNYAYLVKTASEHGGVDNYINDIRSDGYQKGHERGMIDGVAGGSALTGLILTGVWIAVEKYKKHKRRKEELQKQSELSEEVIRMIYEENNLTANDLEDNDEEDLI